MINRNSDPWLIIGCLSIAVKVLLAKVVATGNGNDPMIGPILKIGPIWCPTIYCYTQFEIAG